ncbi:Mrx20p NDAI_0B06240 [Naumovozyma dairenensis CBS 421]|uniref:Mitochondrial carrier protein n=1 Tax=Naumovozyma dairenensis (strain ATCC 10597 / BCRC 20456 / CBS 421 / NBRC 0211 / NRRL Y-12639) TaxID=1071378 RepID=G0W794_NAUDC|nr:hypothetical protein NDAI_0B06240 [Naumovozyma dairenensis CBS 421]CCD23655.1 hypothetical protein NDAI_0B06240 [Naumovozyma dairenensis CBS 421]
MPSNDNTFLINQLVAGCTAAIFQTTISYPFEYIKTGIQLQRNGSFNVTPELKTYFSGCSALNVGAVLKTTLRFGTFDKACDLLRDPNMPKDVFLSGPRLLVAGMLTGIMESVSIIPFENLKTTMIENGIRKSVLADIKDVSDAVNIKGKLNIAKTFHKPNAQLTNKQLMFQHYEKYPSTNIFSTVKEIYLTRGFRGFLQGSMPTMLRQVSNSAVRFTTYTTLKQIYSSHRTFDEKAAFAIGAVSSCAVVAMTQPIDVVKTRMQSKFAPNYYKNSINCVYRIFVEEGISTLWKGWMPRLFKVGLSGGISFGVYEYVNNLMNTVQKRELF